MQHSKEAIRELIAQGQLEEAIQSAKEYADFYHLDDFKDTITAFSSNLQRNLQQWMGGLLSQEEYNQTQAKVTYGLINLISSFPDQSGKSKKGKRKPLKQSTFKFRLLIALLIAKLLVVFRLFYHWGTGGFNNEQILLSVSLLLPTMIIYTFVIFSNTTYQTTTENKLPRYISRSIVIQFLCLIPIYVFLLGLMVEYKVNGTFKFSHMGFGIAIVESILGLFIARLIALFYKF